MEPVNLEKLPGVARTLDMIQEGATKFYEEVYRIVSPYASLPPLSLLLVLYLLKFLVLLPLSDVFKASNDKCTNTDKFCGNTFQTFYDIFSQAMTWFVFIWITLYTATGFRNSGIFELSSYLPLFILYVVIKLFKWAAKGVRLINPNVSSSFQYNTRYTWWHLIQQQAAENTQSLVSGVEQNWYFIFVLAAVITVGGKYSS
jgi:hypothetical protein